jgi:hypothetical protein
MIEKHHIVALKEVADGANATGWCDYGYLSSNARYGIAELVKTGMIETKGHQPESPAAAAFEYAAILAPGMILLNTMSAAGHADVSTMDKAANAWLALCLERRQSGLANIRAARDRLAAAVGTPQEDAIGTSLASAHAILSALGAGLHADPLDVAMAGAHAILSGARTGK